MNLNTIRTSDDRSPFDLPKKYNFEDVTEYLNNKHLQLLEINNFDVAMKEMNALLECSKKHGHLDYIKELEQKISFTNSLIEEKNIVRDSLYDSYLNLKKSKFNEDIKKYIVDIQIFSLACSKTEEYHVLISQIADFYLQDPNINYDKLIELFELILTFDPLKYVVKFCEISIQKKEKSFVLFDLDSTLFDNSPRVIKIIREFIQEISSKYPEESKKLSKIHRQDIIWGIRENLKNFGVEEHEILKNVVPFWYERFFSNSYIIDIPLKGSISFIKDLVKTGVEIVYLTGRFESMREGTARNIREYGFPLHKDTSNLIMKPDPKMPDHTFKLIAMEEMKKFGNMISGFDNEPINTNIFKEHFPKSEIFLLETNNSPNPPNLLNDIHTIFNFEYLM